MAPRTEEATGSTRDAFTIRSFPDNVEFTASRKRLAECSQVFEDMFTCCDDGYDFALVDGDDQALEIPEPANIVALLLHLLNGNLEPYSEATNQDEDEYIIQSIVPDSPIPLPVLLNLYQLADKYMLRAPIVSKLDSHLAAYASTYPLRVYGLAVERGLDDVAAEASMHLLHPPLSSYTAEEIKVIPTAEAYHKLLLLHSHRIKRIREVLLTEPIFPHGYGECSSHSQATNRIWQQRARIVAENVEAATDVAAEMSEMGNRFVSCQTCTTAFQSAIAMLQYKCLRIERRIDELPV